MGLKEITFARRLAQNLASGKCSVSDNSNYDNVDEKEDDGVLEELQLNSPFPVKKEKEKKQQFSRTIEMGKPFTTSLSDRNEVSRLHLWGNGSSLLMCEPRWDLSKFQITGKEM